MSATILTLTPLAIKYIDLLVMAAIRKGYQDADGMTPEELATATAELEGKADEHDAWIEEKLAKAREEGRA